MSIFDQAVVSLMPLVPKAIVGRVARPYIAGDTLDDGMATVRALMAEGCRATMDVLGEEVTREEEAVFFTEMYLKALDRIARDEIDANISIKLSALGQKITPGRCEQNVHRIMDRAVALGSFVRLDMEDSSTTDDTLTLYRQLRGKYNNVGVVLQAMLHRSLDDIRSLIPLKVSVRVCKGIYREPESIAYRDREKVRENFMAMVELLLQNECYVGIATHDRQLVQRSFELVERMELSKDRYEFQMLLGVLPGLRREIVAAGHRLRVYVPYGEAWYAYSTRRLKENPAVAGYVFRAMFSLNK
jgi:proline dehydrogenase